MKAGSEHGDGSLVVSRHFRGEGGERERLAPRMNERSIDDGEKVDK